MRTKFMVLALLSFASPAFGSSCDEVAVKVAEQASKKQFQYPRNEDSQFGMTISHKALSNEIVGQLGQLETRKVLVHTKDCCYSNYRTEWTFQLKRNGATCDATPVNLVGKKIPEVQVYD